MSFIVHVLATATTLAAGYLLKAPRIEVDFWHGAADELLRGGSGEVRHQTLQKLEEAQRKAVRIWQRARAWSFARFFVLAITLALGLRMRDGRIVYRQACACLCAGAFYVVFLQRPRGESVRCIAENTA